MARSKITIDQEERSYSAVFLIAVGLLLATAIWAVWDDNISRRPWKKFQAEFSELQIGRARDDVTAEEKRLADNPDYQKIVADLKAAQTSVDSGESAARLKELDAERKSAMLAYGERDLNLRIKKSEIEEAWYDFDEAKLTGHPIEKPEQHLNQLQAEKAEIDKTVEQADAKVKQIDSEIAEIKSVVTGLETKKSDMEKERDRLQQRLDGMVLKFGPFNLPTIPKIQQVVLHEFDRNAYDQGVSRVDRCQSCHPAIDKSGFDKDANPFRTHPDRENLLAKHPTEKFGCTPCHGGQGPAVNSVEKAHGEVKFWEHPLLRGTLVQGSCIGCHADLRIPHAETIARGEYLFEQLGCHGCHLVEGYGELDKVGPYLRRIGAKVQPEWLVRWVNNPHEFRPKTKMPNFMFSKEQATAIASYLLDASKKESDAWLAEHDVPANVNPNDAAQVERGKNIVDSIGCRGCHGFADGESPALIGDSKDIVPNLANIAEKTSARWIYHWLKGPRDFSPEARMPSLRLSDQEAADVTAFLVTLGKPSAPDAQLREALQSPESVKAGEALVRKYGCEGCHNVPGMETESRIGVELTTFGSKPLEELFFGNHTDIPENWYDWTYNKIKQPRTYETKRIEQLMPRFDLEDTDIRALLVFLSSRQEAHAPSQYRPSKAARERALVEGRRVVNKYNCVGCHVVEKRGGAILARYEQTPTMAPPILNGEGAKVQPNWLFGFLKHPVPLRPWLKLRMPTFGLSDKETQAVIEYFLAQESVDNPFVAVDQTAIPADHIEAGRTLSSADYFNCFSCHQQGDRKPEGQQEGWAPDLTMAKQRLQPSWIVRWLRDPQAVQPGTKMPSFYNFADETPDGPSDVLGGDDAKQVEALRDWILSLQPAPAQRPQVMAEAPAAAQPAGEAAPAANSGS